MDTSICRRDAQYDTLTKKTANTPNKQITHEDYPQVVRARAKAKPDLANGSPTDKGSQRHANDLG